MDAPIAENESQGHSVHTDSVQYVKPYVMVSTIIKACMVVIVTFCTNSHTAGLLSALVGSSILFLVTLLWFRSSVSKLLTHLSSPSTWSDGLRITFLEPCTLPAFNFIKITGFISSAWSAVIVLWSTHHAVTLTTRTLFTILLVGWGALALLAGIMYYVVWRQRVGKKLARTQNTCSAGTGSEWADGSGLLTTLMDDSVDWASSA
jgi:hypothetical protein